MSKSYFTEYENQDSINIRITESATFEDNPDFAPKAKMTISRTKFYKWLIAYNQFKYDCNPEEGREERGRWIRFRNKKISMNVFTDAGHFRKTHSRQKRSARRTKMYIDQYPENPTKAMDFASSIISLLLSAIFKFAFPNLAFSHPCTKRSLDNI